MKKRMHKTVAVITAMLAITVLFSSCSLTGNSTQYKETDGGYGLYRNTSTSTQTVFTVPDAYEGKPVTELMAFCLANSEYLKELNIGDNLQVIDVWALTNCPVLEKINVSENNPYFTSVDGVLYNKDKTELLCYPNGKAQIETDKDGNVLSGGTLVLPETVVSIRDNACYMCTNLYSVTFNEGLVSVGDKAFLKCGNLQKINLPDTLKTIGTDAFSYCNSVTELEIPASVTSIGDYAFFSTSTKLQKIVMHHESEESLTLGKDWVPNAESAVNKKIPVEYVGVN